MGDAEESRMIQYNPQLSEPTPEEKIAFDTLIERDDALGMYVLQQTMRPGTFTSLYHSFHRGSKGKYQQAIDLLLEHGKRLFDAYLLAYTIATENDDDLGQRLVADDVTDTEFELIKERKEQA